MHRLPRSIGWEQVICEEISRRGAGAAELEWHRSEVFSANSAPLREMVNFQHMLENQSNFPNKHDRRVDVGMQTLMDWAMSRGCFQFAAIGFC